MVMYVCPDFGDFVNDIAKIVNNFGDIITIIMIVL